MNINSDKKVIKGDTKTKKLTKEEDKPKKQSELIGQEIVELLKQRDKKDSKIFFTKLQNISGIFFAIFFSCYLQNTKITFLSKNEIGIISIVSFIIFIISLIKG